MVFLDFQRWFLFYIFLLNFGNYSNKIFTIMNNRVILFVVVLALLCGCAATQGCDVIECNACANQTSCALCNSGYSMNQAGTACTFDCPQQASKYTCNCHPTEVDTAGICFICQVDNCILCDTNNKAYCQLCKDGYIPNADNSQCVQQCTNVQSNCDCLPNLVNTGSQCLTCQVGNCLLCAYDNAQSCDFCEEGYLLVASGGVNICEKCGIDYCQTCNPDNINECLECFEGTTLNANTKKCEILKTCTAPQFYNGVQCVCPPGLYVSGQQNCAGCSSNCVTCTSGSQCTQCQGGYFLSTSSLCKACSANCLICSSASLCLACQQGYSVGSNGKCSSLHSGVSCSITITSGSVTTAGSFPGSCIECQLGKCLKCSNGFYLKNGVCKKCQGANCQTCNPNNPYLCASCFIGKTLVNSQCLSCPTNCLDCTNPDFCKECDTAYFVNTLGTCSNCGDNCLLCTSATNCLKCGPGYTVIGGECAQCLLGCSYCNATLSCLACNEGFYKDSKSDCQVCPQGCKKCSSATVCSECRSGYTYDSSSKTCIKVCAFPCFTCNKNKPTHCLSCFAGFEFIPKNNTCQSNISCNANKDCTFCPSKFALIANNTGRFCVACNINDANCIACQDDLKTCSLCADSYFMLPSLACKACSEECLTCDNPDTCLSCKDGYYMVTSNKIPTGICKPCSSNHFCQTCYDAAQQCFTCLSSYTLKGQKCLAPLQIQFNLELQGDLDLPFMKKTNKFKSDLISQFGDKYKGKPNLFSGKKIEQGSVNYDFVMSVYDNDTKFDVLDQASSVIATGKVYNDIKILSGTFTPNYQKDLSPQDGSTLSQQSKLGLILGLSIPLGLLALITLFLVMRRAPKHSQFEEDNVISAGKLSGVQDI